MSIKISLKNYEVRLLNDFLDMAGDSMADMWNNADMDSEEQKDIDELYKYLNALRKKFKVRKS